MSNVYAQQDAMFTHYMFNTNAINPAYAGSRGVLSINGLHRSQWVGLDGAPVTQTLNIHSPIPLQNTGLGLQYQQDKIGITRMSTLYADFSHKLKLSEKLNFALGFKAGIDKLSDNLAELNNSTTDAMLQENYKTKLLPNFGGGLYLYSDKFYAGFSVPRFLKHDYTDDGNAIISKLRGGQRHYFLIAGMAIEVSEFLVFKPTAQVKVTKGAPVELDLTGTMLFNQRVWFALMFRTADAVGCMAGVNVTEQLALGYSYDWSYANLSYNRGSHEVVFRYDFIFKDNKKIHSPRYF